MARRTDYARRRCRSYVNARVDRVAAGRLDRREWARWHRCDSGIELLEAAFEAHVYERHMHDTYAIGVTLRGVQRFWCVGAIYDSTPGNVIVINPGEVHDGRSGTAEGYAYRMIYLPVDVLRNIAEDMAERPIKDVEAPATLFSDGGLAQRVSAAWAALAGSEGFGGGDELLYDALSRIMHRFGVPANDGGTFAATELRAVRDYLHAHVERTVRVQELALLAGMSRYRLTRQFQRAFGLPLHAYHLNCRLQQSQRRLRRGLPVVQVAAELGFADQSHFHRRFKGAFGIAPGAWQAAVRS